MNNFLRNPKKALIFYGVVVGVLFVSLFGMCLVYNYQMSKMGLAKTNFPWRVFSLKELSAMYKQEPTVGVAVTQTPEQTHAKFIEALTNGNYEEAVNCCVVKSKRAEYLNLFKDVEAKGLKDVMVGDLSEISLDMDLGESMVYVYSGTLNGEKVGNTLSFIKNLDGVFLIDSL